MLYQFTCIVCGTHATRHQAADAPPKYCGRTCFGLDRRGVSFVPQKIIASRACAGCGQDFVSRNRSAQQRFCSQPCFTAHNTGAKHPLHKPKVHVTCQQCGKTFDEFPYRIGRRFCSRACAKLGQAPRPRTAQVVTQCSACGKSFLTWPYRLRDGYPTCSRRCAKAANRRGEERQCEICGTAFYAKRQQVTNSQGRFCSIACRGIEQRILNRIGRNSWKYREWRQAVYERDNRTCRWCGRSDGPIHAHHVKLWSRYPALRYDVANGLTLCADCHVRHHVAEGTGF